jgi:hypothetical protein
MEVVVKRPPILPTFTACLPVRPLPILLYSHSHPSFYLVIFGSVAQVPVLFFTTISRNPLEKAEWCQDSRNGTMRTLRNWPR